MENKINLVELLKDCPSGMELDCALFEGLEFDSIADNEFLPIYCRVKNSKGGYNVHNFTEYGQWDLLPYAKCVIFPKGKTTWEDFHRPFKDGDVVAYDCLDGNSQLFIFKEYDDNNDTVCYLFLDTDGKLDIDEFACEIDRLATEEEQKKLFEAIKANGYHWNPETKKLVKLKFKVGDRIVHKQEGNPFTITEITDGCYKGGTRYAILITQQDNFELTPNKFDINTLKPFKSEVLVRTENSDIWEGDIFVRYDRNATVNKFHCIGGWYEKCIPFKGNELLLGTTDDCEEYYKTWEKNETKRH